MDLDPEACLRQANLKFTRRFSAMEKATEAEGKTLVEMPLEVMEALWQAVKKEQQNGR
ncbi:MAG: hypothetical protein JO227_11275 [Acetobacteraceae bacterium]|nr:hypothetical protein [Acetobacteraceae bacterium]